MNKFDRIFSKYSQSADERSILDMAENVRTKIDRDNRIVEINCEFPQIIPKKYLYQIEESIRAAYELNFVRLIPRYPGSFSRRAICGK